MAILHYKGQTADQVNLIHQLQENLDSTEYSLACANSGNTSLQDDNRELSLKLEHECDLRTCLEKQYTDTNKKGELLERKVQDLRQNVNVLNETKKQLTEDNLMLKQTLGELEFALKIEREKKWWKNAADIVLETIQTAAHVMLPALPKSRLSYTNTETDVKDTP